ncbi:CLAVATA3/ESR (CLE)-related protein 4A-2-like [Zingiber officinale]|uniref:CLAVATA3/ESR (CLE)-related protein 4A-2-like n=1 Tax=Zingiber officinale TaxID=94328 RepID=UPI001C4B412D|nr:CLAVATA3/ESR (CLE)-related protein 4A-2-like [Zingiber officinale]
MVQRASPYVSLTLLTVVCTFCCTSGARVLQVVPGASINHGEQGNGGVSAMRNVPGGPDPIHNGVEFGVQDIDATRTVGSGPEPIQHSGGFIDINDVGAMRKVPSGPDPIHNGVEFGVQDIDVGFIDRNDVETMRLVPQGPNRIHTPDQNANDGMV